MKTTIRLKLFAGVSSIILFIFVALFLANTFLSRPFFLSEQKNKMENVYALIDEVDDLSYQEYISESDYIEITSNIEVFIIDGEDIIYNSRGQQDPEGKSLLFLNHIDEMEEDSVSDDYSIYIDNNNARPDRSAYLLLYGTLINGYDVVIRSSLSSIEYNISITNHFIIYIGIASLILGMILTYLLSRTFTKPLVKINETAKKIKDLDFSKRIEYNSKDEIGELSSSINEMADSLFEKIEGLKKVNSELVKETKKNNILLEKRRQLLNDVSHDLKTPLALIQGYSEALKLNVNNSKEKADFYCDVISEETRKMNLLVEELLDVNRTYSTLNKKKTEVFEINNFMHQELQKYRKMVSDKRIYLQFDRSESTEVKANRELTDRVVTNFLINAIRHVDENLKVRISIKVLKKKVRVSFFNTCHNIKEEDLAKLWDAFYKLDDSRNSAKGGHGLGLSIVRNIQESLGLGYGAKLKDDGIVFWFEMNRS